MTDYEIEYQNNPAACGEPFAEFQAFFESLPLQQAAVLDLGCGQGRDAIMIAQLGHQVHGVDLSPTGIKQMVAEAKRLNLRVTGEAGDLLAYRPTKTYDIVLLDRVLHMLPADEDRLNVLKTAANALNPAGYMLIADTAKNLPKIESFFANAQIWKPHFNKKGFRFYQKLG